MGGVIDLPVMVNKPSVEQCSTDGLAKHLRLVVLFVRVELVHVRDNFTLMGTDCGLQLLTLLVCDALTFGPSVGRRDRNRLTGVASGCLVAEW